MSELAARLIFGGILLIAVVFGANRWLAQHDKVRDQKIEDAANARTDATAKQIGEQEGVVIDDITAGEVAIAASQQNFQPKYQEVYRASKPFRDAVDTPVPVGLSILAKERWQERQRLDCNEGRCGKDGGDVPAEGADARRWFDPDVSAEDTWKRVSAGSEP